MYVYLSTKKMELVCSSEDHVEIKNRLCEMIFKIMGVRNALQLL
jgi:hypothetical protein